MRAGLIGQRRVGILGFGSQGRAQALNIRDGGVDPIIGVRAGASFGLAEQDGFRPISVGECAAEADILAFCLPDGAMPAIYHADIEPNLSSGQCLVFCHGFTVRYGQIRPPDFVDVALVAPSGPGAGLRSAFAAGSGIPGLVSAHQDVSGECLDVAVAYGWAIGCRAGLILSSVEEETETDLFAEQVVLCGGLPELIRGAFDTLVESGYQPEVAYSCCLHEVGLISELIVRKGLAGMRDSISQTAAYGGLTVGPSVIGDEARMAMRAALARIRDGAFASELGSDEMAERFDALKSQERNDGLERIGGAIRHRFLPGQG